MEINYNLMTILDKIMAAKRKEVDTCRSAIPVRILEKSESFRANGKSLKGALQQKDSSGIIAEFKRRSPSRGLINNRALVTDVTTGYVAAGAAALSVLTDREHFGGTLEDLKLARQLNNCSILRKDFIIDEYQLIESKAAGADVVLLIATMLADRQVLQLAGIAKNLGLEVILEVHCEKDLEAANTHIDIIGVNNRDLKTFRIDLNVSRVLYPLIPEGFMAIAESGISDALIINELKKTGYRGFLIGEFFMSAGDPVAACRELITGLENNE